MWRDPSLCSRSHMNSIGCAVSASGGSTQVCVMNLKYNYPAQLLAFINILRIY